MLDVADQRAPPMLDADRPSSSARHRSRRSRSRSTGRHRSSHRRGRSRDRSRSRTRRSRSRDRNQGAWTPPPTRSADKRLHASGWDIAADGSRIAAQDVAGLVAAAAAAADPNMNADRLAMIGSTPVAVASTLFKVPLNAVGQPINANGASGAGPVGMAPGGVGPRGDRQMRRLYAGNLPHTTEHDLMHFFNVAMRTALVNQPAGDSVISVYLNMEKRFGFIEFRSIEEATAGLALDGVVYGTFPLKIRRPSDYNPAAFPTSASAGPTPSIDVSRLGIVSTQVPDGPGKIFCGGLPYELNEDQVRELLETYGPIKAFHLVRDKDSAMSKGYCFFEYADQSVSAAACAGLNDIQVGDRVLTVRPAYQKDDVAGGAGMFDSGSMMAAGPVPSMQPLPQADIHPPSEVVILLEMVTEQELSDDSEYNDIVDDIREECTKYGVVESVVIPRPGAGSAGVGKVFVKYGSVEGASKARDALSGRRFDGRTVVAHFYSRDLFNSGQYS